MTPHTNPPPYRFLPSVRRLFLDELSAKDHFPAAMQICSDLSDKAEAATGKTKILWSLHSAAMYLLTVHLDPVYQSEPDPVALIIHDIESLNWDQVLNLAIQTQEQVQQWNKEHRETT